MGFTALSEPPDEGPFVIRRAEPRDADALSRLIGQLGYSATPVQVISRLPEMEARCDVVLVAEIDGAVIGCLTASVMRVLHRPAPVGRISMMVVDESCRSRGIGAQLVRAAEEELAALQCYMVDVTSRISRTDAHRFYERLGYERNSVKLSKEL